MKKAKKRVDDYVEKAVETGKRRELERLNKSLVERIIELERERDAALRLSRTKQTLVIKPTKNEKLSAVPFIVASDWHVEETVKKTTVNGLNEFNLEIADRRIGKFFSNSLRLLRKEAADTRFDTVVLALLGDFISGNIHEELKENCSLRPIEAILWVQQRIVAGIRFLLENTNYRFVVVCHPGNHSRITEKTHYSTETGNSLEFLMYHNLKLLFSKEKRLEFVIADGYHTYLELFGKVIRLHHGHAIRYYGGIGGIFIPVFKAIAQWNKARVADLDVFGHFHQLKNGGNFICNGSLIGYSPFSIRMKADYEKPYQKFFMLTSTGIVVAEYPIFLE